MEMKVSFAELTHKQNILGRKQHRCRHNNSGYCKMEADCLHFHSEKICEQFLMNGKCEESKQCIHRHPKECKFWLNDPQGCLRGDICTCTALKTKGRRLRILKGLPIIQKQVDLKLLQQRKLVMIKPGISKIVKKRIM